MASIGIKQAVFRLTSGTRTAFVGTTNVKASPSSYLSGYYSSTTRASQSSADSSEKQPNEVQLLYQRDTERNMIPKAAYGMSVLNTSYWLWYTLDFIPAVNATPIADMHIKPAIGWGALALGVAINVVTAMYPSSLVSKLEYVPSTRQLQLYRHHLPLLNASKEPATYTLGEITLDPSASETKKILSEYDGDLTKYQGHLPIRVQGNSFPLLVEIREPKIELQHDEVLLQALLNPHALTGPTSKKRKPTGQRLRNAKRNQKNRRR